MPRSSTYRRLANAFTKQGELDNALCWLCGKPINYHADPNAPDAHTVDHLIPVSKAPHLLEDAGNFRHAHRHHVLQMPPDRDRGCEEWQ